MKLTEHFDSKEFEYSNTAIKNGIDNTVPFAFRDNIAALADILEVIREEWGQPIIITSGYRHPKLNKLVGGAANSLHCDGLAVDFTAKDKRNNGDLFRLILSLIKLNKIECRTLIWEYGNKTNPQWVHLDINGGNHTHRINNVVYLYSK